MSNSDVYLTLINWRCFDVEIRSSFFFFFKNFSFSNIMIWEQKCFFRVNPKSTSFESQISTLFWRWWTDFVSALKYGYFFNVNIKILILKASWYKNKIVFLELIQNQRCFNVKMRRWFNVDKLELFRRWNMVIFSTLI